MTVSNGVILAGGTLSIPNIGNLKIENIKRLANRATSEYQATSSQTIKAIGYLNRAAGASDNVLFRSSNPLFDSSSNIANALSFLRASGITGDGINSVAALLRATNTERLLGDGEFDARYVEEQIYGKTGFRFLSNAILEAEKPLEEQIASLYASAALQKESLGLELGKSLTKRQKEGLTEDIVWLERKKVNDKWVLAPTVYLGKKTRDRLSFKGVKDKIDSLKQDIERAKQNVLIQEIRSRTDKALSSSARNARAELKQLSARLQDTQKQYKQLVRTRSIRSGVLSGGNVAISTTGVLKLNNALLLANEELKLDVKGKDKDGTSIQNNYGILEGGSLKITAAGDISNKGLEKKRKDIAPQAGS